MSPFPRCWRVVVLVAVAALAVVHATSVQDISRLGLTRAIVFHGSLRLEPWAAHGLDRAAYHGHYYSDKAPGMSFLAVPPLEVMRAAGLDRHPRRWDPEGDLHLWALRFFTGGLAFLACVVLVGSVASRVVPGSGAPTAAVFGAGTIAAGLAATTFGHVTGGLFGFLAFVAAWQGPPRARTFALAGAAAGTAVLVEYQVGLVGAIVAGYVLLRGRLRGVAAYAAGAVPPLVVLGIYDRLAFGSPFHLSYDYVANRYSADQQGGFFGIGAPKLHSLEVVLVGNRGLVVVSPVLVAAVVGLVLMWRRLPAEAAVCALVTAVFLVLESGYFLPYGGKSPGPRFFVPALPFLVLGIPFALRRWRLATLLLAAVSVALVTVDTLTWSLRPDPDPTWTVDRGEVVKTLWVWLGANRLYAAAATVAVALAALVVAAAPALPPRRAVKAS